MKRTIEQAKKYAKIEAPNGFKFDVSRYLYGFSHGDEYPAFKKEIKQDEQFTYYKRVYFFKRWDKTAVIYVETFSVDKNGGNVQILNRNPEYSDEIVEQLPKGTRYSPKLLFKYCI